MTARTLEEFQARWYQPSHAAIVVFGGITHAQVLDATSRIPRPPSSESASQRRSLFAPVFTRASYPERDPETSVHLYFPSPADTREQLLLSLATDLLTDFPFGILTQRLRYEQRLIYNIGGAASEWPLNYTSITSDVLPQHFAYIEEEILAGIDRLIHGEYPTEILNIVRARRRFFFATRVNGPWVDWLSQNWLKGDYEDFDHLAFTLAATREDISAVAAKYLTREQYGVIHVVPQEDDSAQENR